MNLIQSKPRNRLVHDRVDKLEYISINTRTRFKEDMAAGMEITEEEKAEQEDRLLLHYDMNKAAEEMIEAEKNQELELLAELHE